MVEREISPLWALWTWYEIIPIILSWTNAVPPSLHGVMNCLACSSRFPASPKKPKTTFNLLGHCLLVSGAFSIGIAREDLLLAQWLTFELFDTLLYDMGLNKGTYWRGPKGVWQDFKVFSKIYEEINTAWTPRHHWGPQLSGYVICQCLTYIELEDNIFSFLWLLKFKDKCIYIFIMIPFGNPHLSID